MESWEIERISRQVERDRRERNWIIRRRLAAILWVVTLVSALAAVPGWSSVAAVIGIWCGVSALALFISLSDYS